MDYVAIVTLDEVIVSKEVKTALRFSFCGLYSFDQSMTVIMTGQEHMTSILCNSQTASSQLLDSGYQHIVALRIQSV